MRYLSWLIVLLLQRLALGRSIDAGTWEVLLRRQWNARLLEEHVQLLGTEEEPIAWTTLPMSAKVDTLHALCEWQMERPERLRAPTESDDDARVDPAGWDRQGNTYWLFDDNRLWIQRPKQPLKRKAAPKNTAKNARSRTSGRRSSRIQPAKVTQEEAFGADSDLSQLSEEEEEEREKEDWVEWEAIAIDRTGWDTFAARFAGSKHPDERSLHSYISKEVYPRVLEVMNGEERKAALEAAMASRKRSSRIAMKESEREVKEREDAEHMAERARVAAVRAQERDDAAHSELEQTVRKSREERLREREERLLLRERMLIERAQREEEDKQYATQNASERGHGHATQQAMSWQQDTPSLSPCLTQSTPSSQTQPMQSIYPHAAPPALQPMPMLARPHATISAPLLPTSMASAALPVDARAFPPPTLSMSAAPILNLRPSPPVYNVLPQLHAPSAMPKDAKPVFAPHTPQAMSPAAPSHTTPFPSEPAPSVAEQPPSTPKPLVSKRQSPGTVSPNSHHRRAPSGSFPLRSMTDRSPLSRSMDGIDDAQEHRLA
ncbi:hypothetical protein MVES_001736 [Malassezia vespertilionis]|uniref:Uncharacterized protein n=1 Tax=Malassezia vespertilionis TaxID=2020962 RepID=A0A2N1JDA8_9BASI|nr:hypothetical protein MVES_001736 [Malassezia vespertilionis]